MRYRDLRSHNNPGLQLTDQIPQRLWDKATHHDPEFETLTYGDNCETSPRAAALKQLEPDDFLFFLARLARQTDGKSTRSHGFYLIGYFEIDEVLREVCARPDSDTLSRFGLNAHVRRGLSDTDLWDRFWVFRGSHRSRRFDKAVPITRAIAVKVFTSADGSPWRWENGRTELQVIGSYTRSCRCVIDPGLPGHAARAARLWQWVAQHSDS